MNDCLSGDDSGLTNVWEEVCVQVQFEQSVAWDAYLQVIEGLAEGYVADLKKHELDALWLATPAGEDWSCEDEEERGPFNPITDDIVRYVVDAVLSKACKRRAESAALVGSEVPV